MRNQVRLMWAASVCAALNLRKSLPLTVTSFAVAGLWLCLAPAVAAQTPPDPLTTATRRMSDFVKGNIIKSAEKMPEENYSFRPTPEVRGFGATLGHIANSNYSFCSQATGGANPSTTDIEKTVTSKAGLVKALNESFAYCDGVLAKMSDKAGSELVKFSGGEMARLGVLNINAAHNYEHYGNLITYLRIKGLVPPSSERAR